MENYCEEDWRRFVYTWGLAQGLAGECLELGSNPYFTTMLLKHFTSLNVTLANYFGPQFGSKSVQQVCYRDFSTQQMRSEDLEYYHFSVEAGRFPFDDGRFDVVLFCEIIEHLQMDAVSVLREISRILRPGGSLILTTPNVNRLENVARMIAGANIYDPYSGYGPYGRHNREFNRHELNLLLRYCGFNVITLFTADVHLNRSGDLCALDTLVPVLRFRELDLGQYIFSASIAAGVPGRKRPSWLYRSYPDGELE
jgi:SAM-dependent methyltransferase